MKFGELKAALSRAPAGSVYLVEGEDAWQTDNAERLIKKSLDLGCEELNVSLFFGDETPYRTIRLALEVLPFGAERRLVTVRNFCPKGADLEDLAAYTQQPAPGTVLVIVNRAPTAELRKKIKAETVDCGREREETVIRWAAAIGRNKGLAFEAGAAELLCDYCLYQMARIVSELDKLADCVRGRAVTRADVATHVAKEAEYQVYELTESILRRDGRATGILGTLLEKNDARFVMLVIGALFANFARMYAVKTSGMPTAELAKRFRVKEYAVRMCAKNAERLTADRIARDMALINDYEYAFKSGKMTADIAVRQIVARLQIPDA